MKKLWIKIWVYIVILLIIVLTILGMMFLSNNVNISFRNAEIVNKIINEKASKIKEDYPWVYAYKKDNKQILIPYININSKLIKKINEENTKENLENVKQASYLYSINNDLLSIIYTKEYENKIEYKIYNISLKTSKLMNSQDVLTYLNMNYDDIYNKILLSCELYLKKYNYTQELFDMYLGDTNNNMRENGFEIYIGSNQELYVLVDIFHDKIDTVLIPIVDK